MGKRELHVSLQDSSFKHVSSSQQYLCEPNCIAAEHFCHAIAAEHPKAGLLRNMDKGVMADNGDELTGRSNTPDGNRKMEAHRSAWGCT